MPEAVIVTERGRHILAGTKHAALMGMNEAIPMQRTGKPRTLATMTAKKLANSEHLCLCLRAGTKL